MTLLRHGLKVALLLLFLLTSAVVTAGEASSPEFGFAKVDITPDQPLRLSGYGNRTEPFVGIDEQLWVRAMVFTWNAPGAEAPSRHALVSVDTIGLPGSLVTKIAREVEQRYEIPRKRFVVCFTHSHTTPHIADGLTNIFAKPLTEDESAKSLHYTNRVAESIVGGIGQAIAALQPGNLSFAQGSVKFAQNRRVLKDGKWVGFGVNPAGPVDFSFPILKIVDGSGKVRGVVFNYACHCTTFDSNHNRINGDWAGYSTKYVESQFPGACALCTIGCGADANPPRDRAQDMDFAKAEGQEIAAEVQRLCQTPMRPITAPLRSSFGYADLPFELPTKDQLIEQLDSRVPKCVSMPKTCWRCLSATVTCPPLIPIRCRCGALATNCP